MRAFAEGTCQEIVNIERAMLLFLGSKMEKVDDGSVDPLFTEQKEFDSLAFHRSYNTFPPNTHPLAPILFKFYFDMRNDRAKIWTTAAGIKMLNKLAPETSVKVISNNGKDVPWMTPKPVGEDNAAKADRAIS